MSTVNLFFLLAFALTLLGKLPKTFRPINSWRGALSRLMPKKGAASQSRNTD